MSYQAVPATFSQIRLPEDLLLLQQVLENLVEHFFMLNTPTRAITSVNSGELGRQRGIWKPKID